jgi:beta-glucosidase
MEAGTAAIMPYYGVPMDQTDENVAMGFNKAIVTGLLRDKYHYDGIVCTDWGLITDQVVEGGAVWPARAWGVEHLDRESRALKALDAGVDQFGGESCPELVVSLVKKGRVTEDRLDKSLRRVLRLKFQLGLFDNPFVDPGMVGTAIGNAQSSEAGLRAQRRSVTLLKNDKKVLPLASGCKIFVKNIDLRVATSFANLVSDPGKADFAIIRLETPWTPVETDNPIARDFHHGDLDFKGAAKEEILALCRTVPTIVVVWMDRPAVIPEISAAAKALLAVYGASDAALLDVLFGFAQPEGKLPFELPSSMDAVRRKRTDVAQDSENPLYRLGFGLTY